MMPLSCSNLHYTVPSTWLKVSTCPYKDTQNIEGGSYSILIDCFAPGIPTSPGTQPALMATSRRSSARAQLLTGTLMIRLTKSIYILVSGKIFGGNFLSQTKIKVWDLMTFNFWIIFILDEIEHRRRHGSKTYGVHFMINCTLMQMSKRFFLYLINWPKVKQKKTEGQKVSGLCRGEDPHEGPVPVAACGALAQPHTRPGEVRRDGGTGDSIYTI